jgi:imidazoleglycerol-phosphate dehydratase
LRLARIDRQTTETRIRGRLNLDGRRNVPDSDGTALPRPHARDRCEARWFDLELEADGDLDVDAHHTVEDVGIALGDAVRQAIGSKRGINRAGYFVMPMDETLAVAACDLSAGRMRWSIFAWQ